MTAPHRIPPPPPTRRSADVALVLGLLALPTTFVTGVPAIVFGVKALRAADQVGGRGRAWTGIVLGGLMTALALVVAVVLGLRLVDGLRDLSAPQGSERAQQRDAERVAEDDAALVRAVGVPLEELRALPGVTLTHDAGSTVDCVGSCSAAELAVTGAAARTGALARDALLERLRRQGYAETVRDGIGCRPLDPARSCYLRPPGGSGLVELVSRAGSDYLLRVDAG